MGNIKFDKILGLLEPLETDSVGEWIKSTKEQKTILNTSHGINL